MSPRTPTREASAKRQSTASSTHPKDTAHQASLAARPKHTPLGFVPQRQPTKDRRSRQLAGSRRLAVSLRTPTRAASAKRPSFRAPAHHKVRPTKPVLRQEQSTRRWASCLTPTYKRPAQPVGSALPRPVSCGVGSSVVPSLLGSIPAISQRQDHRMAFPNEIGALLRALRSAEYLSRRPRWRLRWREAAAQQAALYRVFVNLNHNPHNRED